MLRLFKVIPLIAALVLLAACQSNPAPQKTAVEIKDVLKAVERAAGGWQAQEEAKFYNKENLYDLMNGQSDAFFVYGFEQVGVQRFTHSAGAPLMVSIFQVDGPDSAYGLFSANRDPQPLDLGCEGSASPGQRLSFWQDRYFVQLTALKPIPEADLEAAGEGIAAALPEGGETPALVSRLPEEGRAVDAAPLFFHQEISIQDRVWLGGENLLDLDPQTDGVLALYEIDGQPAWLIIVEYPEAAQASGGAQALAGADELLAVKADGKLLAAAFGQIDAQAAQTLVESALE